MSVRMQVAGVFHSLRALMENICVQPSHRSELLSRLERRANPFERKTSEFVCDRQGQPRSSSVRLFSPLEFPRQPICICRRGEERISREIGRRFRITIKFELWSGICLEFDAPTFPTALARNAWKSDRRQTVASSASVAAGPASNERVRPIEKRIHGLFERIPDRRRLSSEKDLHVGRSLPHYGNKICRPSL